MKALKHGKLIGQYVGQLHGEAIVGLKAKTGKYQVEVKYIVATGVYEMVEILNTKALEVETYVEDVKGPNEVHYVPVGTADLVDELMALAVKKATA